MLLDDLQKQLDVAATEEEEEKQLQLNDENLLLSSANALLLDEKLLCADEEEDLLNCTGKDDAAELLLASGPSDREALLSMLDDPINDEIAARPIQGLVTPRIKEAMAVYSTPGP